MRRTVLALTAAATMLVGGSLVAGSAQAMTLSTPAAVQAAVDHNRLSEDVRLICRRVWQCGPWGCGWRQSCYDSRPRWSYRHYRPRHRDRYWR